MEILPRQKWGSLFNNIMRIPIVSMESLWPIFFHGSFDSTTDSICKAICTRGATDKRPEASPKLSPFEAKVGNRSRFQWFLGVLFCLFVALFGWLLGWFSCFAVCVFGWLVAWLSCFFLCVGLVWLGCLVELLVVECVNNKNWREGLLVYHFNDKYSNT